AMQSGAGFIAVIRGLGEGDAPFAVLFVGSDNIPHVVYDMLEIKGGEERFTAGIGIDRIGPIAGAIRAGVVVGYQGLEKDCLAEGCHFFNQHLTLKLITSLKVKVPAISVDGGDAIGSSGPDDIVITDNPSRVGAAITVSPRDFLRDGLLCELASRDDIGGGG